MKITAGTLADRLMHVTISLARFVGGASILLGVLSYLTNTLFNDELRPRGVEWLDLLRVLPCFLLPGVLYLGAAQILAGRHVMPVVAMLLLSAVHAVPAAVYAMVLLGEFWPLAIFFTVLLGGVLMTLAFSLRLLIATIAQARREARCAVITIPQSKLRDITPPPKANLVRPQAAAEGPQDEDQLAEDGSHA